MRDCARMENARDWEAAMSDGSMDDDQFRSSGDDEAVPENWEGNMDWELNSTGVDGGHYVYPPTPFVEVPTISSRMLEYYEQLFESSYDSMAFYQEENFARMERIKNNLPGRNLPSRMPIWTLRENRLPVVGRPGHIQYRHPNEPLEHCMDPMLAGGVFPWRTHEEGNITMPVRSEYEVMCLWGIYESATAEVITEAVTTPVLDPTWGCEGGAPVDIEGYPLRMLLLAR
eukprot:scaffold4357_cov59-Attheya_sp.AAC.1